MYQITYQICVGTEAVIFLRVLFHGLSSRRLCFDPNPVSVGFVVDLLALGKGCPIIPGFYRQYHQGRSCRIGRVCKV